MIYHILNGDFLADIFTDTKIEGDLIIVREGLIDGELSGDSLQDFWKSRAHFLETTEADYYNKVVCEFEKILVAPDDSEFNLWFEYDLFCQVNMWFVISIINSLSVNTKVYVVYTTYLNRSDKHFWNGYGTVDSIQLQYCLTKRILLSKADLQLGQELWTSYKENDFEELTRLAKEKSFTFPYLQEVVKAHLERFPAEGEKGRPERVIENIMETISTDFNEVFKEFRNRESIYGFGNTQLKRIYDRVIQLD